MSKEEIIDTWEKIQEDKTLLFKLTQTVYSEKTTIYTPSVQIQGHSESIYDALVNGAKPSRRMCEAILGHSGVPIQIIMMPCFEVPRSEVEQALIDHYESLLGFQSRLSDQDIYSIDSFVARDDISWGQIDLIGEILLFIGSTGLATAAYNLLKTWVEERNGRRIRIKVDDIELEATQMSEKQFLALFEKIKILKNDGDPEKIDQPHADLIREELRREYADGRSTFYEHYVYFEVNNLKARKLFQKAKIHRDTDKNQNP